LTLLVGHQTCENRRPHNLYCVGADVKPCSINQSILMKFGNKYSQVSRIELTCFSFNVCLLLSTFRLSKRTPNQK